MSSIPSEIPATLVEEVRALIADQVLLGQGQDLTATTPLLELGILDSFDLLKLVAELNERYAIGLAPEEIRGAAFADVNAIARLVASRRIDAAAAGPAVPATAPEGVVVFEEPDCAQLFVLFTGRGRDMGMKTPEFFRYAGLERRNIIVLHDPQENSYRTGISPALPNPDAICAWLRQWIAGRPWLDEVYCAGFSSGGPMAMLAGQALAAKTVWAFGPRTAAGNLPNMMLKQFEAFLQRVTGKTPHDLLVDMTDEDRRQIDAHVTPELIESYHSALIDPDKILNLDHLAEIVAALSRGNGVTEHRVYYVAREACDARVVEALRACPGVVPIVVPPSEARPEPWAFSAWVPPLRWVYRDHMIVDLLRDRGQLGTLFPAFQPARVHREEAASA
jgi:acyl carrier protein